MFFIVKFVRFGHRVSEFFAGQQLAQVEQQINAQNELFKEGKSTFYEKLNEFSDLSQAQFEKEKEGAKIPRTSEGRSLGAKLPPKSEWYTSPELLRLYASRQAPPKTYDATALGKLNYKYHANSSFC